MFCQLLLCGILSYLCIAGQFYLKSFGTCVAACGSLTGACVRASAKLCSARWPARPFPIAQEFHLCAAPHLHILSCKWIFLGSGCTDRAGISAGHRKFTGVNFTKFYLHWSGTALPLPGGCRTALKHRHTSFCFALFMNS